MKWPGPIPRLEWDFWRHLAYREYGLTLRSKVIVGDDWTMEIRLHYWVLSLYLTWPERSGLDWKALLCKLLGHWPEPSNIARSDIECCWFCRWCHDEMYDSDIDTAWKRPWYRWAAAKRAQR